MQLVVYRIGQQGTYRFIGVPRLGSYRHAKHTPQHFKLGY